jgi:succinoglycan biosynthesis protein ExoA
MGDGGGPARLDAADLAAMISDADGLHSLPNLASDVSVSVVIPARGAADLLAGCLAALVPQLHGDDEIIIAAGDEATARAARALAEPRVLVVENPAGTTPAALNAAIAAARHPVIIRVDAQSRVPSGYRDRVVTLLSETGAVNVGGRQVARGAQGTSVAIAAAMNARLGHGGAAYRSGGRAGPVDTVYLGAFRADALHRAGGYDERFTTNQDAELNERLRRAGGTVWLEPALEVTYLPRTSLRGLARQFLGYGRGRAMTAREHPGSLGPRQLAAPVLVLGLLAALIVLPWTAVPLAFWAGGYGCALLLGSLLEGGDARKRLPVTVAALAAMHLAWGYGFLTAPRPPRRT